ncbi:bifunctional uridylate/adenylate kinase [Parahypoxylon ruwenzoriense]
MAMIALGYLALGALGVVSMMKIRNLFLFLLGRRNAGGESLIEFRSQYSETISETSWHPSKARPNRQPLIILILGAPGVGKGTISAYLKASFPGLTHLSYGDLARYQDSIPGSWVSSFPRREGSSSPLLPAGEGVKLIYDTIWAGVKRGQMFWVVDGFPRTEEHVIEWTMQMPPAVCTLYMTCPSEISVARVFGRAKTSGRPDDADQEKVRNRVERAHANSESMINALEESGMRVVRVDADRDLEIVKQEVLSHVQFARQEWESGHLDLSY